MSRFPMRLQVREGRYLLEYNSRKGDFKLTLNEDAVVGEDIVLDVSPADNSVTVRYP